MLAVSVQWAGAAGLLSAQVHEAHTGSFARSGTNWQVTGGSYANFIQEAKNAATITARNSAMERQVETTIRANLILVDECTKTCSQIFTVDQL